MNSTIRFVHALPPIEHFYPLFLTTGWNEQEALEGAIQASWFFICAYEGTELIGTGRLLSDGAYQCFLCDVIVRPDRQGQGIGKEIVGRLVEHARLQGIRWLHLTSAPGKRGFYEKIGFAARPEEAPGMELRF